ncbi:hypothetical protein DXA03_14130 [Agathobacter rectalis]|uniref:Class IIb bacteriocin, lactobin A/cerein 7B family n=3 Tax=Agathobacter rectalis TaxID=39491 RepID=A0A413M2N6_9FIRM|nr:hypothetical protein DXA03_14130 [Agathobacter rectalis]
MDYDLIVVKTLERVYKNYYYIIRGERKMNAFEKISNEEMMCIDGGFNPGVILPGVAAVWVCYEIGYAVGKAFVHATSR